MSNNPLAIPINNMQAALDRIAPDTLRLLGTQAVNDSKENFRRQGFAGVPWQQRKNDKDTGRAILIGKGSGHLKNSIHIVGYGSNKVTIGTGNLPYAKAHNEGFKEEVYVRSKLGTNHPGHYMKMNLPKRQYMGMTPTLKADIKKIIQSQLAQVFKILK